MDDSFDDLLRYAAQLGVQLNGILPRRLPGRGYGMVATRDVQAGETVLAVPTRALRTLATVAPTLSRRLLARDVSVHGILAADLVLSLQAHPNSEYDNKYAAWDAVLPTLADLEGMPLLWPAPLQELLPSAARTALTRQQAKLQRDWAAVKKGMDEEGVPVNYETYRHAWLLVNSRTFYYTPPRSSSSSSEKTKATPDDCMAMQPVADLFNHAADHGCRAAYAADGFSFVADRDYADGDEVPISYGAHSNDALLVEYGFILNGKDNRWDEVALDAVLVSRLTAAQARDLDDVGFLGKYMVDAQTPGGCYRTTVALRRILCGPGSATARVAAWHNFVAGVPDDDDSEATEEHQVEELLLDVLDEMISLAQATLKKVEELASDKKNAVGTPGQRELLSRRWHQIESMAVQCVKQLRGEDS